MSIAIIHPYIKGPANRIGCTWKRSIKHINQHSGVLHRNGAQILDWYQQAKRFTRA
jgi:hypothetical protein